MYSSVERFVLLAFEEVTLKKCTCGVPSSDDHRPIFTMDDLEFQIASIGYDNTEKDVIVYQST